MLICLYILPKTIPRYAISTQTEYYLNHCPNKVSAKLSIPIGNGTFVGKVPDATW